MLDPAKRKAAKCGRRAGKSHVVGAWLLDGAIKTPGTLSAYVALARPIAKKIMWPVLHRFNRRYGLGMHFDNSELIATLPNGSQIWVAGCNDESELEKFRGPCYRRVAIDEAASFKPYLKELIDDVLTPALVDHDGDLALIGSPGAAILGYFYEATAQGKHAFALHEWTVLDNPFIPNAARWLERMRAEHGIDESDPGYQREWCGRWVRDDSALIYPYDQQRNAIAELPTDQAWEYVLAIDLGFVDSTAFVIIATCPDLPWVVVVASYKRPGMTPTEIAAEIKSIQSVCAVRQIVMDSGGLGRGYVEEFRRHHSLAVEAAEKQHKIAFASLLSGDMRAGRVKLLPNSNKAMVEEMALLCWNATHTAIDDRMEDHLCDALAYGYRKARRVVPDSATPEEEIAKVKEQQRLEQEDMDDPYIQQLLERAKRPFWRQ